VTDVDVRPAGYPDLDPDALPGLGFPFMDDDQDPEYVLAYIPPRGWKHLACKLFIRDLWGLYTPGEWLEPLLTLPPVERLLFAARSAPEPQLAARVQAILGYPVALEQDSVRVRVAARFARWHEEPIYWVRRNT
jgi:hypothetical protein